ncbi:MAG: DsrE family protein [Caldilineales bacterium]|nr:DsrE family protein [Caldilineales bacterium]
MTNDGERTYLFIINDAPYGNERPYNALRLAMNLAKSPEAKVQVFLVGDGVNCALAGQKTPNGYYNIERMVQSIARQGQVAT